MDEGGGIYAAILVEDGMGFNVNVPVLADEGSEFIFRGLFRWMLKFAKVEGVLFLGEGLAEGAGGEGIGHGNEINIRWRILLD